MIFKWISNCVTKLRNLFVKESPTEPLTSEQLVTVLENLEENCKDGNPSRINLEDLIKVSDNVPESLSIELFSNKSMQVSFLSTTSQGLLEAVSKKYYNKQTIIRSHLISPCPTVLPLNEWWSNDESINFFLLFMKDMTEHQLALYNDANAEVQLEKKEFLDTYLYRILISDYINLLKIVIMEVNI